MTVGPGRTYLPLFWDLTGRRVLIVGGGKAAGQKVRALFPFGVPVTVVSPDFTSELKERSPLPGSRLTLVEKPWDEADLNPVPGFDPVGLVLACTGDFAVNDAVVAAARARGIPVLDAARPARGDFIQPAARKTGGYTLAVSSGGAGPRGAVAVRDALAGAFDAAVDGQRPRS